MFELEADPASLLANLAIDVVDLNPNQTARPLDKADCQEMVAKTVFLGKLGDGAVSGVVERDFRSGQTLRRRVLATLRADGQLVAFAAAERGRPCRGLQCWTILALQVAATHQGHGVGSRALAALSAHSELRRARLIVALPECIRAARGFYVKNGFLASVGSSDGGQECLTRDPPAPRSDAAVEASRARAQYVAAACEADGSVAAPPARADNADEADEPDGGGAQSLDEVMVRARRLAARDLARNASAQRTLTWRSAQLRETLVANELLALGAQTSKASLVLEARSWFRATIEQGGLPLTRSAVKIAYDVVSHLLREGFGGGLKDGETNKKPELGSASDETVWRLLRLAHAHADQTGRDPVLIDIGLGDGLVALTAVLFGLRVGGIEYEAAALLKLNLIVTALGLEDEAHLIVREPMALETLAELGSSWDEPVGPGTERPVSSLNPTSFRLLHALLHGLECSQHGLECSTLVFCHDTVFRTRCGGHLSCGSAPHLLHLCPTANTVIVTARPHPGSTRLPMTGAFSRDYVCQHTGVRGNFHSAGFHLSLGGTAGQLATRAATGLARAPAALNELVAAAFGEDCTMANEGSTTVGLDIPGMLLPKPWRIEPERGEMDGPRLKRPRC